MRSKKITHLQKIKAWEAYRNKAGIGRFELSVLSLIYDMSYTNKDAQFYCTLSVESMADALGCTERTIQRCRKLLIDLKIVEKKKLSDKQMGYRITEKAVYGVISLWKDAGNFREYAKKVLKHSPDQVEMLTNSGQQLVLEDLLKEENTQRGATNDDKNDDKNTKEGGDTPVTQVMYISNTTYYLYNNYITNYNNSLVFSPDISQKTKIHWDDISDKTHEEVSLIFSYLSYMKKQFVGAPIREMKNKDVICHVAKVLQHDDVPVASFLHSITADFLYNDSKNLIKYLDLKYWKSNNASKARMLRLEELTINPQGIMAEALESKGEEGAMKLIEKQTLFFLKAMAEKRESLFGTDPEDIKMFSEVSKLRTKISVNFLRKALKTKFVATEEATRLALISAIKSMQPYELDRIRNSRSIYEIIIQK